MNSFVAVQLLSCVQLVATPWTAARQASWSITNSWSLLKLMSIESVMPSNHFIFCRPLLCLPSIFPSNRVFSNESVLHIRYSKLVYNVVQFLLYSKVTHLYIYILFIFFPIVVYHRILDILCYVIGLPW